MVRKGNYRGGIDKKIPQSCMFKIYEGIYKELMKQPTGKKSLKDAITSWERGGGFRKLRAHYSQLTTGSMGPMYKESKTFFMIAYKRITSIFNEVRDKLKDTPSIRDINFNERQWIEFQKNKLDDIEKQVNSKKLKVWEAVSRVHAYWSGQLPENVKFEHNWRVYCKRYQNDSETADEWDTEFWREVSKAYRKTKPK